MHFPRFAPLRFATRTVAAALMSIALLSGCAVVTVAGAAVGVAATGVGLAVDATVGAVRLTGRALSAGSEDAGQ